MVPVLDASKCILLNKFEWNNNTTPLSYDGQITLSKIYEICPLAIPNQNSTILMYIIQFGEKPLFTQVIQKRKYSVRTNLKS